MTADAAANVCDGRCGNKKIYILEVLDDFGTPAGGEQPMPESVRSAIAQALPGAAFVAPAEMGDLFGGDVLIQVGNVQDLGDDVVGVNAYVTTARDGAYGTTFVYAWDGSAWIPATSEATDVPLTTVVS